MLKLISRQSNDRGAYESKVNNRTRLFDKHGALEGGKTKDLDVDECKEFKLDYIQPIRSHLESCCYISTQ